MLQKQTVSPFLCQTLESLMRIEDFNEYVLVGGTALSLIIGHRTSIDIDLFCPNYKTGEEVKPILKKYFPRNEIRLLSFGATVYLPEPGTLNELKIDFMSNEPFIRPVLLEEGIRIASIEDIAAMKLEAVTSRLTKKDFWDIAEILECYSLRQLTEFYKERYPWNDLRTVLERITQFENCEKSTNVAEVASINGKTWDGIKKNIQVAFDTFVKEERQNNKMY